MPRRRRSTLGLLCCVLFLAACDAVPSDPFDARHDLAVLLDGSAAAAQPAHHSLQGLLHAAVHRVYSEQGPVAARALVSDLRRLQDDARRAMLAGDREAGSIRMQAVHAEEVAIVLHVFGSPIVRRVVDGVARDAARVARGVAEAADAGRDMARAGELLAEVDSLLALAVAAARRGDDAAALDAATRAAATADAVHQQLAEARRIAGLAELFDLASSRLRAEDGDAANAALRAFDTARRAAADAARSGDRQRAGTATEAMRAAQIRVVIDVLGSDAAQRLVEAVAHGIAETHEELAAARSTGRDVSRLDRMVATARDMNVRARNALVAGDAVTALDLASHAAGLVNAARLTLSIR
jgi:hypothetical protein